MAKLKLSFHFDLPENRSDSWLVMLPLCVATHQRSCRLGASLASKSSGQGRAWAWAGGRRLAVCGLGLCVSEEGDSGDPPPELGLKIT